ncbi:MAG: hypothetical protein ACRCX2_20135 [Paraclostridium sp.]
MKTIQLTEEQIINLKELLEKELEFDEDDCCGYGEILEVLESVN